MATVADYVADPAAGTIAVSVEVKFTNTLPNPPGQVSALPRRPRDPGWRVVVAARDPAGSCTSASTRGTACRWRRSQPGRACGYNATVSFTLSYRLADGAAPDLHVRPGVVKFPAWGFGTSSQVTVRLPAGYDAHADGDAMLTERGRRELVLTSGPIPDPGRWLALITAILPRDYVTQSASVPLSSGTVDLQVRAWSDDPAWGEQTLSLLVEALPMLEEAIGLPYPRVGPLVRQRGGGGESSTGRLAIVRRRDPGRLRQVGLHAAAPGGAHLDQRSAGRRSLDAGGPGLSLRGARCVAARRRASLRSRRARRACWRRTPSR